LCRHVVGPVLPHESEQKKKGPLLGKQWAGQHEFSDYAVIPRGTNIPDPLPRDDATTRRALKGPYVRAVSAWVGRYDHLSVSASPDGSAAIVHPSSAAGAASEGPDTTRLYRPRRVRTQADQTGYTRDFVHLIIGGDTHALVMPKQTRSPCRLR
jgi:hypothetical protein